MTATPYQRLLTALETDRTRQLESARLAKHPETQLVASSMASAFLHATAMAVREFEGSAAAQAYAERAVAETGDRT
ncbi:hypothetical protein [Streptomyces alboviridis]|uniref:hypothetical protein n=1 Tax=Streptomyces alboviridis TaxID=67269 RepID=UPI000515D2D1|nr:hypothetical protein [Streptomyces alboviridis]